MQLQTHSAVAQTDAHPTRSDLCSWQAGGGGGVAAEVSAVLGLFADKRMLLLAPYFIYSNWFYTFQFSVFNGRLFNARTQARDGAVFCPTLPAAVS